MHFFFLIVGKVTNPENKIITILLGPHSVPEAHDTRPSSHPGLLRTVEDNWSLGNLARLDADAVSIMPLDGVEPHKEEEEEDTSRDAKMTGIIVTCSILGASVFIVVGVVVYMFFRRRNGHTLERQETA